MSDANGKSLEQDLMYAVVKQKYGHLMDDEQLEEARKTGRRDVRVLQTHARHTADERRRTLLRLQALQER